MSTFIDADVNYPSSEEGNVDIYHPSSEEGEWILAALSTFITPLQRTDMSTFKKVSTLTPQLLSELINN